MADILYWLHVLHLYIAEIMHTACNYNDVIMSAMTSQITGVSIICSSVGSGADQRKHQSSASLAFVPGHYIDVIMTTMASQITSLAVVYSTVFSDADQRKHQSSASLAFVWGIHRDRWIPRTKAQLREKCFHLMTSSRIHRWPVNSQHKRPVTRKMFPFDDIIMACLVPDCVHSMLPILFTVTSLDLPFDVWRKEPWGMWLNKWHESTKIVQLTAAKHRKKHDHIICEKCTYLYLKINNSATFHLCHSSPSNKDCVLI